MAEITNELMYEVLNSLRQDMSLVKAPNQEIKSELQAIRTHMIGLQQDVHNIYTTPAQHEVRFDRIELRLGLADAHSS